MKGTPYFRIFADVYRFMEAHYPSNYDGVVEDANEINDRYKDTAQGNFVHDIMLAILAELDRGGCQ